MITDGQEFSCPLPVNVTVPDLGWLGRGLNESLREFVPKITSDALNMDFANLSFPKGFTLPFSTGAEVAQMRDLPVDAEPCQSIISAIDSLEKVWANES